MTRRRLGSAIAAVVFALAVTACAPAPQPGWSPPAWPQEAVQMRAALAPLDPAGLPGQIGQRLRNDAVHFAARYAYLAGAAAQSGPFDAAVGGIVETAAQAQAQAMRTTYTPAAAPVGSGLADRGCIAGSTGWPASQVLSDPRTGPLGGAGTAVTCDLVFAAGTVFGERLRVVSGDPSGITADTTTTLYTDTATGEVATGDAIWTADAPGALAADVVDVLRRQNGSLSDAPPTDADDAELATVRAGLATAVPTVKGISLQIPAGFESPQLTSLKVPATTTALAVVVPAASAATMLTPFGSRLLDAAGLPYVGPQEVAAGFDWVDCTLEPCVALTYDDGPSTATAGILDDLASCHAAATFFVVGEKIAGFSDALRRAVAEGHLVENHTWNHPHLSTLTSTQVADQITRTTTEITNDVGTAPTVFRPPYGQYTTSVLAAAKLPAILWNVDSFDWTGSADADLVSRVVSLPTPGSIVLQHDIQPNTQRTVRDVCNGLLDRGFSLVNLAQLFHGTLPTKGVWSRGPADDGQ